jgi:phosphatidylserine decarboxylase
MTVLDWDKLSSNDHVGDIWLDVGELVRDAPQPDPRTGLYADVCGENDAEGGEGREMKQFCLPLTTAKEMPWEAKHNPTISFRCVRLIVSWLRLLTSVTEQSSSLMPSFVSGSGHSI